MAPAGDETPPEASEAYDAAQTLSDMAQMLRERASKTLHPKTRKYFARAADDLEGLAEDFSAHAEGVESELAGDHGFGDHAWSDFLAHVAFSEEASASQRR